LTPAADPGRSGSLAGRTSGALARRIAASTEIQEAALMDHDARVDLVRFEEVEVLEVTDAALLCIVAGEEHWIAKSLAVGSDVAHAGDRGALLIPAWLAREYRLI
jgi:hypothetical protein